jgi:hypothetical protein
MRLADYVKARVARLGVKHVFAVPGDGSMHVIDTLGGIQFHQPRPRHVRWQLGLSHRVATDGVVMVGCLQAPR